MPDTETDEAFLNIVSHYNRPWAQASYAQGSTHMGLDLDASKISLCPFFLSRC